MSLGVLGFTPLALHIQDVGPMQGKAFTFRFRDVDDKPTNIYMLAGINGLGKTTILECFAYLVSLLEGEMFPIRGREPDWLLDHPRARMQLDILLKLHLDGEVSQGVLSLVASRDPDSTVPELAYWLERDLEAENARWWIREGLTASLSTSFYRISSTVSGEAYPQGEVLIERLRRHIQEASSHGQGTLLFDPAEDAPVLLMFTAHRDLMTRVETEKRSVTRPSDWSHGLVRRFDAEMGLWSNSLDHLLVWMDYLDGAITDGRREGRFSQACRIVNEYVFVSSGEGPIKHLSRVDRERMEAIVEVSYPQPGGRSVVHEHRIDRLSGGEKSIAQIFVRIAAHMSQNTIVLLDEADLHLHPAWERGLMHSLKDMVRDHPGLIVILTTHSMDMLKVFEVKRREDDLRKGGFILDTADFA